MKSFSRLRDFLFRVRYGFRGVPFKVGDYTLRFDERLRRWDMNVERAMHEMLAQSLSFGDTFIDVGANFGLHTIFASYLVGSKGRVVPFEPALYKPRA